MTAAPILPRAQSDLIDARNPNWAAPEWRRFFEQLLQFVTENGGTTDELAAIQSRLDSLEGASTTSAVLQGTDSIDVFGQLANGFVRFALENDAEEPGTVYYYGTGNDGAKGWHDLGYQQSGTGSVRRTPMDKALELPTPEDYAAAGDGVTDDTTPIANALAEHGEVRLVSDYLVTALDNEMGVPLVGPGRVLKAITGGDQQLSSKGDDGQHVFGQEYLYALYAKLMAGTTASMVFSGDSTTEGGVGHATGAGLIHTAVLTLGQARGHKLTATNAGHSGENTEDWITLYLAGDLALNPDLYVVRWGINDPFDGRTIEEFATSLRSGLATIRASKTVGQMAVLLMAPNSTSDTPNNRDERWYEQARLVCRQAARDYQCAFVDTYSLWKDSRPAAGLWMDDPFADGRAIHPMNVMNFQIASKIAELLFPAGFDPPPFGTYTPTLTAVANVDTATPSVCQWLRRGNVITVSGRVDIDCTAAANTLTQVGMSLPVASDLTVSGQLAGGGGIGQATYQNFLCLGDTANNRATLQFLSNGTTSAAAFFSFTYLVQ